MKQAWLFRALAALALLIAGAAPAMAQGGTVTGQVVDRETRQPLTGVQVFLVGTTYGAITQDNGRYQILSVPSGVYTVETQFIGYAEGHVENVRVRDDEITTVDITLSTQVLRLQGVVATGSIDPTAGVKVPFTVGKLSKEDLPVPAVDAVASMRGKISGVRIVKNQGRPGSGLSVDLRGGTSIFRGNEPLFIVDGVVVASSMVDVESLDIETIEVVKGAAASSLYGARAASGVISITTSRGKDIGLGDTRIIVRSEGGINELPTDFQLAQQHRFKMNAAGEWINNDGEVVDKTGRVIDDDRFADNEYPGPLFNHIDRFFDPKPFFTNTVSIAQNTRSTNFMASFTDRRDGGIISVGDEGYEARSLRLNLDHRLRDDVNFSVSSYYSRSERDDVSAYSLYDIMFWAPDVDLFEDNPDGEKYNILPDPATLQSNPFYALEYASLFQRRSRFMGSTQVRYSPANWFALEGNLSYDRSDRKDYQYEPKGFKVEEAVTTGYIERNSDLTQAINGGLTASLLRSFGDLTARTKFSVTAEYSEDEGTDADGDEFVVGGVEDIDATLNRDASSYLQQVRSLGYYGIMGLDYQGKYIAEGLVRRDGSSLFGPENRWNTYFRGSGAWRLSEEAWWPLESVNEFKLRYSIGTAGGRPGFFDRFETWSVGGGTVSKSTLGNTALKPEYAVEQEFGADMIFRDRVSLQLTHARSTVEDQLMPIPLPAVAGYGSQWQNAGTVETNTWEAEIQANLMQRSDFSWQMNLVADRTRGVITEFGRSCLRWGGQGSFYYCEGESLGAIFGKHHLRSLDELPADLQPFRDQFDVNDEGLVVPVGAGNSWRDGVAKDLWQTQVELGDQSLAWGLPIFELDENGADAFVQIGDSNPDFNLGFGNTFQYKNLTLYALIDAQIGGDIYNNTNQWTYRDYTHPDYDQGGKPEEEKKIVDYYQKLYSVNAINDWFVEDGTYTKLREVSLRYSFDRQLVERLFGNVGINRVAISLIGRNLVTWTDYTGFDPEVGAGDATRQRFDGFGYPNFRTLTASLEIEF